MARYDVEIALANAGSVIPFQPILQADAIRAWKKLQKRFKNGTFRRKANSANEMEHGLQRILKFFPDETLTGC